MEIVGTIVRFSARAGSIDVTLDEDNPAVRDLLSMVPLTLTFEDFAGREKIAYPPWEVQFAGSPPSSAGAGDLAMYNPWATSCSFMKAGAGTRPTGSSIWAHSTPPAMSSKASREAKSPSTSSSEHMCRTSPGYGAATSLRSPPRARDRRPDRCTHVPKIMLQTPHHPSIGK